MATLKLPPLKKFQNELFLDSTPNVATVSSTQIGKTLLLALWLMAYRVTHPSKTRVCWWLAPVFKQVKQGYKYILDFAQKSGLYQSHKGPPQPEVVLRGCGVIEFQSWKEPQNLLGPAVDAMVADEAGQMTPQAQGPIRSRRSATLGPVRYIGNPGATSGPFRRLCALGADPTNCKTHSLHSWNWRDEYKHLLANDPTRAAGYLRTILDARMELDEVEFRRLYMAEWTSDQAAIFRNVWKVSRDANGKPYRMIEKPVPGHSYVAGVDVGQVTDYAVICLLDTKDNRAVYLERVRRLDLGIVAVQHLAIQKRFGCSIVVEDNHIGNALIKEYMRCSVSHVPFKTHRSSKMEIINMLAVELARERMTLAEMPPLQHELELYRYDRAPSGNYSYGAPSGEHDDCVMALALAFYGKTHGLGPMEGIGWV